MLKLYRSSNLNQLADELLKEFNNNRFANPLQPDLIIVQNYGMERWLKMYIAQKQGIAANMQIEFPAEQMWNLYRLLDSLIPENLPSDKEPMAFGIFDIILSGKSNKVLSPLHRYIQTDSASMKAIRAWKLSMRIADLFDRYLIYRPQMLLQWQKNKLQTGRKAEQWQASLWRMLQKRWGKGSKTGSSKHRSALNKALLEAIHKGNLNIEQLPECITVFGVSALPPTFLETFIELSKIVDVCFYWLDPVQSIDNDHVLIESWGTRGKDFLHLFHQYVTRNENIKNEFSEKQLKDNINSSRNLLSELRKSILTNKDPEKDRDLSNDRSIQIHSCHSPLREVEVLYDQLLALFDENPDLKPGDVAIMTTDMVLYAPLIEAVFGSVEEGLPRIPFSIADRGRSNSSPITLAFIKIIELLGSRFKVSEVMELLQMTVIQDRMKVGPGDISRLERWIDETKIRWGIDDTFKKQFGLPEDSHFTWQAGLSRMMLGYAMPRQDKKLFNGLMPYGAIGGTDSAELLGNAHELLNKLFELRHKVSKPKSVDRWVSVLSEIVDRILPDSEEYTHEIILLKECIEELKEYAAIASFEREVSFKIVQSYLKVKLDQPVKSGYLGHGVTFSSMVALRNISFEVIGILGMDEESFPRISSPVAFDMMQIVPMRGDPDKAEDDRYLFLAIILSAGRYLYISYTGQNNQQHLRTAPSVLVSELLNVIEDRFGVSKDSLLIEHRLQPFSPYYFNTDESRLFSYSQIHRRTAQQLQRDKASLPDSQKLLFEELQTDQTELETLELQSLISFYQHPSKFVLQKVLGIHLPDEKVPGEDREPFKLTGLDKYRINQELLDELFEENTLEPMRVIFKAEDMLPVQFWGERSFKKQMDESKLFFRSIKDQLINKQKAIEIDLPFKNSLVSLRLKGELNGIYDGKLLLYRFGAIRAKDKIEWWIKHLAWCAYQTDDEPGSFYFGYDKGKEQRSELLFTAEAKTILSELVQQYLQGLHRPFPFFSETSYAFADALIKKGKSVKKASEDAQKMWDEGYYNRIAESADSYNRILYKNYKILANKLFKTLSKQFYRPYFNSKKSD